MNKDKANAIAQTVNTPGWSYIKEYFNEQVQLAYESVIDEEDEAKAVQLRRAVRGGRKLVSEFFRKIENFAQKRDEEAFDDFSNMNFEEMLAAKQKEMESGRASN